MVISGSQFLQGLQDSALAALADPSGRPEGARPRSAISGVPLGLRESSTALSLRYGSPSPLYEGQRWVSASSETLSVSSSTARDSSSFSIPAAGASAVSAREQSFYESQLTRRSPFGLRRYERLAESDHNHIKGTVVRGQSFTTAALREGSRIPLRCIRQPSRCGPSTSFLPRIKLGRLSVPAPGCSARLATHRCRSLPLRSSALTGSGLLRSRARHHPTLPDQLRSPALRSLRSLRVLCGFRTVVLCLTAQDRWRSTDRKPHSPSPNSRFSSSANLDRHLPPGRMEIGI